MTTTTNRFDALVREISVAQREFTKLRNIRDSIWDAYSPLDYAIANDSSSMRELLNNLKALRAELARLKTEEVM